jgi:hypothetical protein
LIAPHDPNCGPTKISGADFQQQIARFRFNEVSATIDNDWSILRFVDRAARREASAKNTVTPYNIACRGRQFPAHRYGRHASLQRACFGGGISHSTGTASLGSSRITHLLKEPGGARSRPC